VSSKQLAVRSKAVVGCLPASCPVSYCLLPLLSTESALRSALSALLPAVWLNWVMGERGYYSGSVEFLLFGPAVT